MTYQPGPPSPHLPLSLRTVPAPAGRIRLELTGELDLATTPMVVAAIDAIARDHQPIVVELDFTGLRFLSSCGVTALVKARNSLHGAGSRLVVTHPQGAVLRVLVITNTWNILRASPARPAVRTRRHSGNLRWRSPRPDINVRHEHLPHENLRHEPCALTAGHGYRPAHRHRAGPDPHP